MVPKNWDNVTIEKYVAFKKTEATKPTDQLEIHLLRVQQACILTGATEVEVNSWPYNELMQVDRLITTDLPQIVVRKFKLNGQRYKFRENPKKYTGGEYSAVMNACKDSGLNNLHRLCYLICQPVNVFGKPVKHKDPEEIEQAMNDFKQLPLRIANPMALFFCTLSGSLTNAILDYSSEKMKKVRENLEKEISYLDGTGG